jgi:hypothetical protein
MGQNPRMKPAAILRVTVTLFALPVLIAIGTPSHGATKCVMPDGKTIYMDGPCPQGARNTPLKEDAPESGPKSLAEELRCAVAWLNDRDQFENQAGIVAKSDEIIWNGRPVDMVAMYRKPAATNFNFRQCGKYGYVQPNTIAQFSQSQWAAMTSACKLLNPKVLEEVRRTLPKISVTAELRGECNQLAGYGSAKGFEKALRAKSHPAP